MKKIIPLICLVCSLVPSLIHGQLRVSLKNSYGYTFVDLEDKLDMPQYGKGATVNTPHIANWDYFFYKFDLELVRPFGQNLGLGLGLGLYRWYYWSYRWRQSSSNSYSYKWRAVKAIHYGILIEKNLSARLKIISGAGFHTMLAGNGTYLGLTVGVGLKIPMNNNFELPIDFRIDFLPLNSSVASINLGLGLTYLKN